MTSDGDTCIRCSAANKECIRPPKRGAACERCREAKKKCQLVPDDVNTRKAEKRDTAAPRKKAEKRETAPPRKRGFKKSSCYPNTAPTFGILRQPTPPESPPAESNNNVVVIIKPLLLRTAAPPPPPRPLKRQRLEEGGRNQPTTHTPSEHSDRSRVTQRQNTAFVEIQKNQGSSSRTHVPLLTGDLPPALETRLLMPKTIRKIDLKEMSIRKAKEMVERAEAKLARAMERAAKKAKFEQKEAASKSSDGGRSADPVQVEGQSPAMAVEEEEEDEKKEAAISKRRPSSKTVGGKKNEGDEDKLDKLEELELEPVKLQRAPPTKEARGKGLGKQKKVPGRRDCCISPKLF
jgi:hypothetical protein